MEKYTVVKVVNHEVGTFQKVHVKDIAVNSLVICAPEVDIV